MDRTYLGGSYLNRKFKANIIILNLYDIRNFIAVELLQNHNRYLLYISFQCEDNYNTYVEHLAILYNVIDEADIHHIESTNTRCQCLTITLMAFL